MNLELANNSIQHNIAIGFETGLKIPDIRYDTKNADTKEWDVFNGFALKKTSNNDFTLSAYYDGEFRFNTIILTDNMEFNRGRGRLLPSNIALMFNNRELFGMKWFKKLKISLLNDSGYEGFINLTVKPYNDEFYFGGVGFIMPEQFREMRNYLLDEEDLNFIASLLVFNGETKILYGAGKKINKAWEQVYSQADKLPSQVYFRTDALESTRRKFESFRELGLF